MPAQPGEESASGSDSEFEDEESVQRGGRKRARGGGRVMAPKRSRQDSDVPATLFEVVRQGKMAMTAIVDDWIEAYKADRNEALLDLIQFFINSSGCKGTVTAEMLRDASEGFQDVIKRMTEEFDEDSGDYPLIASGINFKKFRSNFSDFVQALVRQCQFQIIYDQFMMDNVLTLLTELSNSQVRAFRHTSTLAAMKLMTALVNVALQLSVSLDNTQRQYEGERNKAANKRASEKLDLLLEKRKDLEDQQTEIESMLNGIFKGIFVHRYRDFIADIRALCMEEIGVWMKMFPKVFLTDSYLKYVGWTLHDKQKEVRYKCLQTLQGLYKDDEMTKDLKLFTSRFKDRIVSMTLDKEYDVSVLAIKLLSLILAHCGYDTPVLSSSDAESVYQLVYSVHRPVAVAAAEFLNKQLFANKDVAPGYTKRGRRRSANAPLMTDLVLFFIESELHEHATYLVDSLWDAASAMLKDWECMTDLLLEEPANDRDQLDTRQESALVDIMVCTVKQAAEGIPPTGRQGYSKKLAVRDRRTVLEDRVKLTEHFIVALPSLMNKYQVDKEKVTMLLQIPRFFDLELYTTSRLDKHLEMLLRQMAVIIDKHTDSDLLEQAAMTYHVLCDNDYTMANKAQLERQTVVDSWSENFTLALDIFKDAMSDVSSGADEEEIFNVVQALKRLTQIYKHNNITSCGLHPTVYSILQMYQEKADSVPEDMLDQAVKFIHCDIMYTFALLKEKRDNEHSSVSNLSAVSSPEQRPEIAQLRQRVTEFMEICEDLLSNSPHPKVKEASYMAVCDLIVLFSPQLAHSSPDLRPLVQRPSHNLQLLLIDFVNTFVFVVPVDEDEDEEDNAKIDALHHRRLLLAAICKLFIYDMIELTLAASVFQQYIRFYADYGDIIKETINKSRHANKMECAHTLALSLMTLYRETVRRQGGSLDHSSQEYGHMKELARRLSLTFGLDQVKTRDAVAALHKEGIIFALKRDDYHSGNIPPENLSFLSILVEFSSKLMKQDRKTVVNYLDKHIKPHMLKQQTAGWIPLVTYRNSLLQGADDADTAKQTYKARRGRKKRHESDMEGPRTPMTPATPMSETGGMTPMHPGAQPPQQSTAQREAGPSKQLRIEDPNISAISYQQQQQKGHDLQSWLATSRSRRIRANNRKQKATKKDSIEEKDEAQESANETPKRQKTRSFLASIFDSEEEISERMKGIQVKDGKKVPTKERLTRHRSSQIFEEEEERDSQRIEGFSDDEDGGRTPRKRKKRNPLPDLDEEVITGFVQDAFVIANNMANEQEDTESKMEDEEERKHETRRISAPDRRSSRIARKTEENRSSTSVESPQEDAESGSEKEFKDIEKGKKSNKTSTKSGQDKKKSSKKTATYETTTSADSENVIVVKHPQKSGLRPQNTKPKGVNTSGVKEDELSFESDPEMDVQQEYLKKGGKSSKKQERILAVAEDFLSHSNETPADEFDSMFDSDDEEKKGHGGKILSKKQKKDAKQENLGRSNKQQSNKNAVKSRLRRKKNAPLYTDTDVGSSDQKSEEDTTSGVMDEVEEAKNPKNGMEVDLEVDSGQDDKATKKKKSTSKKTGELQKGATSRQSRKKNVQADVKSGSSEDNAKKMTVSTRGRRRSVPSYTEDDSDHDESMTPGSNAEAKKASLSSKCKKGVPSYTDNLEIRDDDDSDKENTPPGSARGKRRAVPSYTEDSEIQDADDSDHGNVPLESEEDTRKLRKASVSTQGRRQAVPSYTEDLSDQDIEDDATVTENNKSIPKKVSREDPNNTNTSYIEGFKNIARDSQNITIEDVKIDEIVGFWDNLEKEEKRKKNLKEFESDSPEDSEEDMDVTDQPSTSTKIIENKGKNNNKNTKKTVKSKDSQDDTSSTSSLTKSQISVKEKSEFEKPEKTLRSVSRKNKDAKICNPVSRKNEDVDKILNPALRKNDDEDFFSANEDNFDSEDEFGDILSDFEERDATMGSSHTQSGKTQELTTSTNPFWNITKNLKKGTSKKGDGDAPSADAALSDFISEESDSDVDSAPTSPLTQKSTKTVCTHISDVDVMDLLMSEDNQEVEEEVFGAFTNVVRDVHSQSSQNITSLSSQTSKKPAGLEIGNIFEEDDDDDPFDQVLQPLTSRPLNSPMSPLSSDGEDDFGSMFGFGNKKEEKKRKRQPNLIGTTIGAMGSTGPQGYHQQQQQQHYQMPSSNMPGTSQQQFVIPGQPQMMYQQQQQGYQMQMHSPTGHLQQSGMQQGHPPYYGS